MYHAPPLKYGKLDCSSAGFTFSSHHRANPSDIAVELGIKPRLTPSGRVSKKQVVHKQPKSWWEAQVRLYGLKCSKWTVEGMKQVLSNAFQKGLAVPEDLSRMEKNLIKEYRAVDAEFQTRAEKARNDKWVSLSSDVAKADLDPDRFLKQIKSDGGVKVLRGLHGRAQIHQAAERMGLFSQSTDGPDGGYDDRILVVGKDREEVWREIGRIDSEVHAQQRAEEIEHENEIDELHRELVKHGDGGDITGTWHMDMPELTSNYQSGDVTWVIPSPDKSSYAWASFDLLILEGVVRIDWSGSAVSAWKGREKKFTWRGTETGEGVIQYDDSSNGGTVTFTSANTCSGTWWGAYGTFEFTGKKTSRLASASVNSLKSEFEGYNEAAYEYARVARWR